MKFYSKISEVCAKIKALAYYKEKDIKSYHRAEQIESEMKKSENDLSELTANDYRNMLEEIAKKYNDKISFRKMATIIHILDLRKYADSNLDFGEFIVAVKDLIQLQAQIFGLNFNNSAQAKLSDKYGNLYTLGLYERNNSYEISIWDCSGGRSIYNSSFEEFNIKIYNDIERHIKAYRTGKIKCVNCQNIVSKDNIIGMIFAGSYCNDCEKEFEKDSKKITYN